MKPPTPGLRRFVNDSAQIAKLDLRIPAGAEIAVDETVARQLTSQFKDPDATAERDAARKALLADDEPADEPAAGEPDPDATPKKKSKKDA